METSHRSQHLCLAHGGVHLQTKLLLPLPRVGEGPAIPLGHLSLKHFSPVWAGTSQASDVQV